MNARKGGSLRRRMEIVLGGPARPFPLTVREADTLSDCVDAFSRQFQEEAIRDGGEPEDAEILSNLEALRERLLAHAGYGQLEQGPR